VAWDPDAVITGAAAARLSFWPSLRCPTVDVALRRRPRLRRPGFRFTERDIAPPLVADRRGARITIPALTALDLCPELGGDAIDEALRTGAARLVDVERALAMTPARPGNAVRRQLLDDSRDEPWSPAERRFHRLLRAAGLTGWRTNVRVHGDGWRHYIDVAFQSDRLAAEVDGREHHIDAVAFERDRRRQNRLVRAGWDVLRFTPTMIDSAPEEVVDTIQGTLARIRSEQALLASPRKWRQAR
jgi:very-short-patch-repair endonuclease